MSKELNRLNDFFFKFLIGNEQNKNIALNFINAVLGTEESYFTDIIYLDKDEDPETIGSKQTRLDVKGRLNDGTIIELEMQALSDSNMSERSLYYWARMYGRLLKSGEDYKELKPAISVIILGFEHLKDEENWYNEYQLLNIESKKALTKDLRIIFLELPKLNLENKEKLDKLELWGAYFGRKLEDSVLKGDKDMASVLEAEFAFTADDVREWRYEQREKFLHDQASRDGALARADAALKEKLEENAQLKEDIKEQDVRIKEKDARIKELEALLAQK